MNDSSIVYLYKENNYDEHLVKTIETIFEDSKILESIHEDTTVFVKLNLLGPFDPSEAITTNPFIFDTVCSILTKYTKNIIVGDNPAVRDMVVTMKKCGIYEIAQKYGVKLLNQNDAVTITATNHTLYSKFVVSSEIVNSDIIINLPKVKTHSLAYITCAEKNFFGLIYGLDKSSWHAKASNPNDFGEALNDLYSALLETRAGKPILSIADGIDALEGEGPSTGGNKIHASLLLASLDPVSLDRVAVQAMGLNYKKSYITNIASIRGLGVGDIQKINIKGNKLEDFSDLHFKAPKDSLSNVGLKFMRINFVKSMLFEHPLIDKEKCIKCGECAKICPPKAMQFEKGKNPHAIKKTCIRCWCCAEVCPKNAIYKSSRPLLGKIVLK